MKIAKILTSLAEHRPVFHSEADFQHAFAWEIHRQFPDISLRLEYPFAPECHLDIWVIQRDGRVAIELKYKTQDLSVKIDDEEFTLKGHSAHDCGRYDFIKDVARLEQVIESGKSEIGYAILLTNDSAYWNEPRNNNTIDKDFRLHEGRVLVGKISWGEDAGQGTMRGREKPLNLKGRYSAHWENYPRQNNLDYDQFRYLLIRVRK